MDPTDPDPQHFPDGKIGLQATYATERPAHSCLLKKFKKAHFTVLHLS
jgi:hypothetical protein